MWINGHTRYALELILISRLSGVSYRPRPKNSHHLIESSRQRQWQQ